MQKQLIIVLHNNPFQAYLAIAAALDCCGIKERDDIVEAPWGACYMTDDDVLISRIKYAVHQVKGRYKVVNV